MKKLFLLVAIILLVSSIQIARADEQIVLPASLTKIDNEAFMGNLSVSEVVIPDGCTTIGDCAFSECTNLSSLTIPASVSEIGSDAFKNCPINTLNVVEGSYAYYWCIQNDLLDYTIVDESSFQYRKLSDSTIAITKYVGPSNAHNLVIPTTIDDYTVTEIASSAFYNCRSLTGTIRIPDTVLHIGEYAFEYCSGIEGIKLPASLQTINSYCFAFCTNLKSMEFPDGFKRINGWRSFEGCTKIESITFPDSTEYIARCTFGQCESIKEFVLPPKITIINDCTFYGCRSLKKITIPYGVKEIQNEVFFDCQSLESIVIPDSVTTFNLTQCFERCYSLQSIQLPANITRIHSSAFNDCRSLTQIVIPDKVASIESNAFANCTKLEYVFCGNSLADINGSAFSNCPSLKNVFLKKTLNNVPSNISNLVSIGDYSPIIITDVQSDQISESEVRITVTLIANEPVNSPYVLLNAGEHLNVVGEFDETHTMYLENQGRYGVILTGINNRIGSEKASFVVKAMKGVDENETIIAQAYSLDRLFSSNEMSCIAKIHNNEDESVLINSDGLLYKIKNSESIVIVGYEGELAHNLIIPECINSYPVTEIDDYAFANNQAIDGTVNLPKTLNRIGNYAFYNCRNITGNLVTNSDIIGAYSFAGCSGIDGFIDIEGANFLGIHCFDGCTGMRGELTIPVGISIVPEYAFYNCFGLTSIYLCSSVEIIERSAFENCTNLTNGEFLGVKSIDSYAFRNCTNFESLLVKSLVDSLGTLCFKGCNKLIISSEVNNPLLALLAKSGTVEGTKEIAGYKFENKEIFDYEERKKFDMAFLKDATNVNPDPVLANHSINAADEAYNDASGYLKRLGFANIVSYDLSSEVHTAGHYFGVKTIYDEKENPIALFAVIIRGTNGTLQEWRSNLTPGKGTVHEGFRIATNRIMKNLQNYINSYFAEEGSYLNNSNYKLWITGHSRGAACGNILAADYSLIPDSNIFAYLFATPNTTKSPISSNNIKNFVFAGDVVTRMAPSNYGYTRNGITIVNNNPSMLDGRYVTTGEELDELMNLVCAVVPNIDDFISDIDYVFDHIDDESAIPFNTSDLKNGEIVVIKTLFRIAGIAVAGEALYGMDVGEIVQKFSVCANAHYPSAYQIWMRWSYPM